MAGRESAFCLSSKCNQREFWHSRQSLLQLARPFQNTTLWAFKPIQKHFKHIPAMKTNDCNSYEKPYEVGFWRRLHKYPWDDIFIMHKEGQVKRLSLFFLLLFPQQSPTCRAVHLKKGGKLYRENSDQGKMRSDHETSSKAASSLSLFYTSNVSLIHPPPLYQGESPAVTPAMHSAVSGEAIQEGSIFCTQCS